MSFPTTRWSLIAAAAHNDGREGRKALEELCRRYREPVLSFFRSRVHSPEDAEDLTQTLFLQIHQKHIWQRVNAEKGRFRNYVLTMATHAFYNWRNALACEKRGGRLDIASLDLLSEKGVEPAALAANENVAFDVDWASAAMSAAWSAVEDAAGASTEKSARFAVLRRFLPGADTPLSYEEASEILEVSTENVRTMVMRLRRDFRTALRAEIADTILESENLDEEMQYVYSVMRFTDGSESLDA